MLFGKLCGIWRVDTAETQSSCVFLVPTRPLEETLERLQTAFFRFRLVPLLPLVTLRNFRLTSAALSLTGFHSSIIMFMLFSILPRFFRTPSRLCRPGWKPVQRLKVGIEIGRMKEL